MSDSKSNTNFADVLKNVVDCGCTLFQQKLECKQKEMKARNRIMELQDEIKKLGAATHSKENMDSEEDVDEESQFFTLLNLKNKIETMQEREILLLISLLQIDEFWAQSEKKMEINSQTSISSEKTSNTKTNFGGKCLCQIIISSLKEYINIWYSNQLMDPITHYNTEIGVIENFQNKLLALNISSNVDLSVPNDIECEIQSFNKTLNQICCHEIESIDLNKECDDPSKCLLCGESDCTKLKSNNANTFNLGRAFCDTIMSRLKKCNEDGNSSSSNSFISHAHLGNTRGSHSSNPDITSIDDDKHNSDEEIHKIPSDHNSQCTQTSKKSYGNTLQECSDQSSKKMISTEKSCETENPPLFENIHKSRSELGDLTAEDGDKHKSLSDTSADEKYNDNHNSDTFIDKDCEGSCDQSQKETSPISNFEIDHTQYGSSTSGSSHDISKMNHSKVNLFNKDSLDSHDIKMQIAKISEITESDLNIGDQRPRELYYIDQVVPFTRLTDSNAQTAIEEQTSNNRPCHCDNIPQIHLTVYTQMVELRESSEDGSEEDRENSGAPHQDEKSCGNSSASDYESLSEREIKPPSKIFQDKSTNTEHHSDSESEICECMKHCLKAAKCKYIKEHSCDCSTLFSGDETEECLYTRDTTQYCDSDLIDDDNDHKYDTSRDDETVEKSKDFIVSDDEISRGDQSNDGEISSYKELSKSMDLEESNHTDNLSNHSNYSKKKDEHTTDISAISQESLSKLTNRTSMEGFKLYGLIASRRLSHNLLQIKWVFLKYQNVSGYELNMNGKHITTLRCPSSGLCFIETPNAAEDWNISLKCNRMN